MAQAIRILLIDDQTTIRQALQMLLEREPGFEIVGGAADGETGLAFVERLCPDIVLVDIEMPGIDGIETASIIHNRYPSTKVLMLTGQDDKSCLQRALQAGAKGYLLKTTPAEDLVYAIRAVQKGYSQVSPGLIEKMMESPLEATPTASVREESRSSLSTSQSGQFMRCIATLQEIDLRLKSLQPRIQPLLERTKVLQTRLNALKIQV